MEAEWFARILTPIGQNTESLRWIVRVKERVRIHSLLGVPCCTLREGEQHATAFMQWNDTVQRIFYLRNPARKVGVRPLEIEFDIAASIIGVGIAVITFCDENIPAQLDLPRAIGIDLQNPRKIHCAVTAAERCKDIARRIQDFDAASLEFDRAVFIPSCRIIIDPLHGNCTARNIDIFRHRCICRIGLGRGNRRRECRRGHKRRTKCKRKGDLCAQAHLFAVCIRLHVQHSYSDGLMLVCSR